MEGNGAIAGTNGRHPSVDSSSSAGSAGIVSTQTITVAPPPPTLFLGYDENLEASRDPMDFLDRGYKDVDLGVAGDLAEMYYETIGSHRRYHRLTMLASFAAAIQHRYLGLSWARGRKLRPNIYGVLLGHTTLDHKTTALNRISILMPFDQLENCKKLPGYFTEEGMYKELSERPFGIVVKDEIGSLFASRDRKHLESVIPFLTGVYDGGVDRKRLSNMQYEEREVALTIIGATTFSEFFTTTRERDWSSGWLVRWLYALPDNEYDPAAQLRVEGPSDRALEEKAKRRMVDLGRIKNSFAIEQSAFASLIEWRRDIVRHAYDVSRENPRVGALVERYATYAYKFAMILCAIRGDGQNIMERDAIDAARLVENFMSNVYALYKYAQTNRVSVSVLQKALERLSRRHEVSKMGMSARELAREMHWSGEVRDAALEKLQELGAVIVEERGKSLFVIPLYDRLPTGRVSVDMNN